MQTTVRAEIHLGALRHNLALARELAGPARVLAMIKADAYGHGLVPVARALAPGADGFGVARFHEALALREAGVTRRILLLGSLLDRELLQACARHDIDLVVHNPACCRRVLEHDGPPLRIWLKLDVGMHRLGLTRADFLAAHRQLSASPAVAELVHMAHFSRADEPELPVTRQQLQPMLDSRLQLAAAETPLSLANSAALITRADCRGQWVRPGIMLYGDNPVAPSHPLALAAPMRLRARVLALRQVAPGAAVGYGGDWVARRPSHIATIGIGYGDGYPRHARAGTPVGLSGGLAPLVGRVPMDAITVDVTDLPAPEIGEEAELWGDRVPVAEVARRAGTISYTLLTGVAARVPRHYVEESAQWRGQPPRASTAIPLR